MFRSSHPKFCEYFRNAFLTEHLRTTAFVFYIFSSSFVRSSRSDALCMKRSQNPQKSQENTWARDSFFNKVAGFKPESLFSIKLQDLSLQLYWKRDSGTSVFVWALQKNLRATFLGHFGGSVSLFISNEKFLTYHCFCMCWWPKV